MSPDIAPAIAKAWTIAMPASPSGASASNMAVMATNPTAIAPVAPNPYLEPSESTVHHKTGACCPHRDF